MKIIKTELCNEMSDTWLNDLMVCYIERGIFEGLDLSEIKKDFKRKKKLEECHCQNLYINKSWYVFVSSILNKNILSIIRSIYDTTSC